VDHPDSRLAAPKRRQPRRRALTVTLSDGRGGRAAAPGLARWLAAVAPAAAPRDVAIALVSDARIRALNRQYRRKDRETDVLSFEPSDIVIATGVARRQAREAGHSYGDELKVLALHGLLHLMGYDHHDSSDGGRMGRLERRLRRKGGLRSGLIERANGSRRPASTKTRLRPERGGGANRRAAAAPSERERGWGPASNTE
jgi:probable rRNA maturation factor